MSHVNTDKDILDVSQVEPIVDLEAYRLLDKRVNRKMDLHIMPWVILAYFLNYLDRSNLGNARTLNNDIPGHTMVEQIGLTGDKYLVVVAIFFVPYVLFEPPSNLALKYFTPARWISRIMVSWSIVTLCTAAVTSYGGLIACRIFVGISEAGFFPGILYYLCFWYPPRCRATRMAFFSASMTVAGAFGGLIATGVSFMSGKGGLYGWQWLFILEGIPSLIVGVLIWFFLPNYPESAMWLDDEERAHAIARMGTHAPKGTDATFDKKQMLKTVQSIDLWLFAGALILMTNSGNAFGYFAPTIISSIGYKGYLGQLMTVPPNVFGFCAIVGNSMWSDHTRKRPQHIIGALLFVSIGWILLATVDNTGGRYVGCFFIACTNAGLIPVVSYLSASVRGASSTASAMGIAIAFANISGIITPFVFPASQAPRYIRGLWTLYGMLMGSVLLVGVLWYRVGDGADYEKRKRFINDEIVANETASATNISSLEARNGTTPATLSSTSNA